MDIRKYFNPVQSKPKLSSSQSEPKKKENEPKRKEKETKGDSKTKIAEKKRSATVKKRPSLTIESDSDEAVPSVRSKSSVREDDESPLPPSARKYTSAKHSKRESKPSDEDPLPPEDKKTENSDIIETSDDEDPLPSMKKKVSKRKLIIEDSDEDDDFVKRKIKKKTEATAKTSKKEEKVLLGVSDFFGTAPVKRSSKKSEDKVVEPKKQPRKEDYFDSQNNNVTKPQPTITKTTSQIKVERREDKSPVRNTERTLEPQGVTPKQSRKPTNKVDTPPSSGKKPSNAAAYQAFLNRAGPSAPGSKVVPQGAENCFKGLTFVVTGVLESLERDEVAEIIKKYGGKVTQSISKNTSYMIVGTEAGPAKLEKAEKLGTKRLDEDAFLNLLRSSSAKQDKSPDSKKPSKETTKLESTKLSPPKVNKTGSVQKEVSKSKHLKTENTLTTSFPKAKSFEISAADRKPLEIHSQKQSKSTLEGGVSQMWVDKYKPVGTQHIIGQQGPRSNVNKLKQWLCNWFKNHAGSGKAKKASFGRWGAEDGSNFKAALLSGPPGVGKTTTAQLVCKEAGFTFIELNASDTRSKKSIETIVAEMVHNKSLSQIMDGNSRGARNHCLLMDEVDGMAGNEDRGGVQQLIQLIKSSHIPVICMCNDRQHQKIRSLANYCFDLRFPKPSVESIKSAMMSVCAKEKLNISSQSLLDIIAGTNQDVRQVLHNLCMWTVKDHELSEKDASKEANKAKKDIKLNPFDAIRLVFSAEAHKTMSIHDKSDLFFHDYSLAGLFVQENYLSIQPEAVGNKKSKQMDLISEAADSICTGDLIDKLIRSEGHWNLLPTEAMFASVIPGHIVKGRQTQMVTFPQWLGRNSTRGKNDRILQELHLHTRLRTSGSKLDLNFDYLPAIRNAIVSPIVTRLQDGIPEAINIMNEYFLRREDLDSIIDVCSWPKQENPLKSLSPQVKAAFTRAFNKESQLIPYAVQTTAKKRVRAVEEDAEALLSGDEEADDADEEEDISKDAMIKMKAAQSKRKAEPKAASAGKGGRGGGAKRGKKS